MVSLVKLQIPLFLLFATVVSERSKRGVVRVKRGWVSGVPASNNLDILVFKGIPYAAPPVGALRWRDPQPIAWDGVRSAETFGPNCIQSPMGPSSQTGTPIGKEDCLFLNIWTGALGTSGNGKNVTGLRPVYVWIYGGGFIFGSGSDTQFHGVALARKGLVVVTFNYRLNVFGFLATPELSKESGRNSSGNYGLLDQIFALKWVQKNIAAFGGDPTRVTIGGQSAGAGSVLMLTYSPLAKGLFHRAVAESGGIFYPRDPEIYGLPSSHRSMDEAEQAGLLYAQQHNVSTLAQLRAVSAETLVIGSGGFGSSGSGSQNMPVIFAGSPPLFHPVLDGYVLARTYEETLNQGLQNDIPFMTGNNKDEAGASELGSTLVKFLNTSRSKFGAMADEFLSLYLATNDAEAGNATNDAVRDNSRTSTFLWSAEWLQRVKGPVFTYFWTHASSTSGMQGPMEGATHGSEICFFFGNLNAQMNKTWTSDDYKIADIMSSYLVNFASNGDPNGQNLPNWPRTEGKDQMVMEVGDNFRQIPVANSTKKLDFIKRFFTTQKAW